MDTPTAIVLGAAIGGISSAVPQVIQWVRSRSDQAHELKRDQAQHDHELSRDNAERAFAYRKDKFERTRERCEGTLKVLQDLVDLFKEDNSLKKQRASLDKLVTELGTA